MGSDRTSRKRKRGPLTPPRRDKHRRTRSPEKSEKRSRYSHGSEPGKRRNPFATDRLDAKKDQKPSERSSKEPRSSRTGARDRRRRSPSRKRSSENIAVRSRRSEEKRNNRRVSKSRDVKKEENSRKSSKEDGRRGGKGARSPRRSSRERHEKKKSRSDSRGKRKSRSNSKPRRSDSVKKRGSFVSPPRRSQPSKGRRSASAERRCSPKARRRIPRATWVQSLTGAASRRRAARLRSRKRASRLSPGPSRPSRPPSPKEPPPSSPTEKARRSKVKGAEKRPASPKEQPPARNRRRSRSPRSGRSPVPRRHPDGRRRDASDCRRLLQSKNGLVSPRRSRSLSNSSRKSGKTRVTPLPLLDAEEVPVPNREECDAPDSGHAAQPLIDSYLRTANLIPYDTKAMLLAFDPPAIYDDWASYINADGNTYFYNQRTRVSQWTTPEGFDVQHPCSRIFKYDKDSKRFFMVRQWDSPNDSPDAQRLRQELAEEKQRKFDALMVKYANPSNELPLDMHTSLCYLAEPVGVVYKSSTPMERRIAEILKANSPEPDRYFDEPQQSPSLHFQTFSMEENNMNPAAWHATRDRTGIFTPSPPTPFEYEADRCAQQVCCLKYEYASAAHIYNLMKRDMVIFFKTSNDQILGFNGRLLEIRRSLQNLHEMPAIDCRPIMS